jgi:uroporphyrinogen decarboxylase
MSPKERLHAAVAGLPLDRTPVTPIFMAWAANFIGRTYRDYYLDHNCMVEAQLAVTRRFHLDQISSISDPWREASAFGMQFQWPPEGVGIPQGYLLNTEEDVRKLQPYDPLTAARTRDRIDAVRQYVALVGATHSVLGWVEGPLAAYVDLRGLDNAMVDLIEAPELFHHAAQIIIDCAIAFAEPQIASGADVIGIGDAAASLVGPTLYVQHILPWEQKLVAAIHNLGQRHGTNKRLGGVKTKMHICGNIGPIVEHIARTGTDVIDVDWMVPLAHARQAAGPRVTLAGNFNPAADLLFGTPEKLRILAARCIAEGSLNGARFLLQPGCEVPPATPIANIEAFCPKE